MTYLPIINKYKAVVYVTLIDDNYYDYLNQYNWYMDSSGYARSTINGYIIRLHSLIMETSKGFQVDHINGLRYDNRKINLRVVTPQQNQMNRRGWFTCASIFKGVSRNRLRWRAECNQIHLGTYDTEVEAAQAYDKKANELYGNYAKTNQMMGLL